MAILTDTGFPPIFLNQYILSELKHYGLIAAAEELSPMVPAQFPTNIEDLYNDSIQIRQTENPVLIVYDRLMRFRPTPFYLHKREQLIYFIYSTDVSKLLDCVRVISNALDREDSSAEDVNSYNFINPTLKTPEVLISTKAISNKALTNDFATITTSTAHGLSVGDAVEITGVMTGSPAILDTRFNGIHYVRKVPSATTFEFKKDAANVASIAASGVVSKKEHVPFNILFHNTRVYQADESRDVAELASARTLFVNKLIIEYDYHTKTGSDSRYT
jgi:hypothetical protein